MKAILLSLALMALTLPATAQKPEAKAAVGQKPLAERLTYREYKDQLELRPQLKPVDDPQRPVGKLADPLPLPPRKK